MKSLRTLTMAALAAGALALPVAACAQQAPASPPAEGAGGWQGHHRGGGMMRMFKDLNLTQQQQTQIRQIMQQFRQAHPQGSAPDRQAREQMRAQIMNVLTPQQQAQLKSEMQQMRERRADGEAGEPQPESTPQA